MWLKKSRTEKPMVAAGLAKQKWISLMREKKKKKIYGPVTDLTRVNSEFH